MIPLPPKFIMFVETIAFIVLGSINTPSSELILPKFVKVIGPAQLLVPLIFLNPPELLSPEAAICNGIPVIVNPFFNSKDPVL